MLSQLRMATGPSHARLDEAFGSLDLANEADLRRFLGAHAMALSPLFSTFHRFVESELALPCPDFPAMLAADLATLGQPVSALIALDIPQAVVPEEGAAGVCYVIAGSRLGNAVIRRDGYHGRNSGSPSRYMEDDTGLAVWKALVPWFAKQEFSAVEAAAIEGAALAAFTTFETAFTVSATLEESQKQELNG